MQRNLCKPLELLAAVMSPARSPTRPPARPEAPSHCAGASAAPPAGPGRRRLLGAAAWVGGTLAGGLLAGGTLAGCTLGPDQNGPDAPDAAPLARPPRVAWVLGSGGPRGFVHVGVVKALAALGLAPDVIVGASVGALVGTLHAAGLPVAELERLALETQAWQLLRFQAVGLQKWSGQGLAPFVNQLLGGRLLQALPTPMVVAVQRLRDGAVLGLTRGDAGVAVQAAAAIEGQLAPVSIRHELYADADLRTPLPVRLARALGAQRVLAVDVSAYEDRAPAGSERYRDADLRKRALTRPDAAAADLLLHPDMGYWAGMSRDYRERSIAVGYRATMAQADSLRALHAA